jgi:hypothetical protein
MGVQVKILGILLGSMLSLSAFAANENVRPPTKPSFKKVMTVILENTDAAVALQQPFLKSLLSKGAGLTDYHGVAHPSQPNYVALITGGTQGVTGDEVVDVKATRSIVDLLEAKHKSWKVYAEGFPGKCFSGKTDGRYVRKHNAFVSLESIRNNPALCAKIVNASELPKDVKNNSLPDYSFYIPDLDDDGHDTGVAFSDVWLGKTFGPLLSKPAFKKGLLLVVTFDESSTTYNDPTDNRIYAVLYGDSVKKGSHSDRHYTHYSLLHTIENTFDLGDLGAEDAKAPLIEDVWISEEPMSER